MATAQQALSRVLFAEEACSSSSSSSLNSSSLRRKKKTTTHSSNRGRVIASSSSSSSSERSRSKRSSKRGTWPLRAILEPALLEERASMDDGNDENDETGEMTTTTSSDTNRSAATIVRTDFLVRFKFTSLRRGCSTTKRRTTELDDEAVLLFCQ